MKNLLIMGVLGLLLFSACGGGSIDYQSVEKNEQAVQAANDRLQLGPFSLAVPANWIKELPASSMRLCQYYVKGHPEVKLVGFYFGNRPEMANDNINRWKGQFSELNQFKEHQLDYRDHKLIAIRGTFKKTVSPMAQEYTEAKDYMMFASIIPTAEGPYFFKMVGPEKVVSAELNRVMHFMNSYQAN